MYESTGKELEGAQRCELQIFCAEVVTLQPQVDWGAEKICKIGIGDEVSIKQSLLCMEDFSFTWVAERVQSGHVGNNSFCFEGSDVNGSIHSWNILRIIGPICEYLQVPAAEETAAADTDSTTAASASSERLSQIKVVSCDIIMAT